MPLAVSAIARTGDWTILLSRGWVAGRMSSLLIGRTHSAEKATLAIAVTPSCDFPFFSGDKSEVGGRISRRIGENRVERVGWLKTLGATMVLELSALPCGGGVGCCAGPDHRQITGSNVQPGLAIDAEPSEEQVLGVAMQIDGREKLDERDAKAVSRLALMRIGIEMKLETVKSLRAVSDKEAELRTTLVTGQPAFVYRLKKDGSGWHAGSPTAWE